MHTDSNLKLPLESSFDPDYIKYLTLHLNCLHGAVQNLEEQIHTKDSQIAILRIAHDQACEQRDHAVIDRDRALLQLRLPHHRIADRLYRLLGRLPFVHRVLALAFKGMKKLIRG